MSAFLLGSDSWQRVCDALTDPCSYGHTVAKQMERPWRDLLHDWYKANLRAVSSRYTMAQCKESGWEEEAPEVLPSPYVRQRIEASSRRPQPTEKLIQYVKTLQCLRYQCSEDVPEIDQERHDARMAEIDRAIGLLSERVVRSLPTYDKATWG